MTVQTATVAAVPRLWPGETVVCLACGPSLTADDVDYVRGKARVIAVNDAYRLAPWADVLYACDPKWWVYHQGVMSFRGMKYSLDPLMHIPRPNQTMLHVNSWSPMLSESYGVTLLREFGEQGISVDPTGLKHGKNGGYQAVNLAVLFGAARIVLLGYDMQLGEHHEEHWFGRHPSGVRSGHSFLQWIDNFTSLAPLLTDLGVTVVNCSRRTALTCFPRRSLEGVFP